MSQIFISYRREDSQDVTGRIYDRLVEYFSAASVFKDIDNIPLGVDFRSVLKEALAKTGVMLVIIGPTWTGAAGQGGRRLDSPTDFVRLEVEMALQSQLPVIPVLVSRAHMPTPDELPSSLNQLPYRNGMPVRPDPDFNHDMERLAAALEQWIARSDSVQRTTLNRSLEKLAREKEVERLDREWQMNQAAYPGPIRSRIPWTVLGLFWIVCGIVFAALAGNIAGGYCWLIGVLPILMGIGSIIYANVRASEYEAAEEAYRRKRAIALGQSQNPGSNG